MFDGLMDSYLLVFMVFVLKEINSHADRNDCSDLCFYASVAYLHTSGQSDVNIFVVRLKSCLSSHM